jgi:hypothetical protein
MMHACQVLGADLTAVISADWSVNLESPAFCFTLSYTAAIPSMSMQQ